MSRTLIRKSLYYFQQQQQSESCRKRRRRRYIVEYRANNGSSHIIRKHNHPNVLQDVTFNNSQVLRSFLAKRKRPRQAPTNMGKYFHLFLLHGNAFRWMKPPMSLDNFLYKKYLESNGLMPFAG